MRPGPRQELRRGTQPVSRPGRPGTVERMSREIAAVAAYRRVDGALALLGFTCTREGRQPAGRHTHTHTHSHLRALPQGHGASLVRWSHGKLPSRGTLSLSHQGKLPRARTREGSW